jgi:glycosyltransferase involved in cell wall biosynthesis
MNITIVMVVRNEEYFLPLSLANALRHADNVLVLDTGSTDRTMDILAQFRAQAPSRLLFVQRDFGGRFPFDNGTAKDCHNEIPGKDTGAYREMEARNHALRLAEECFRPDWIIRMDADESFDAHLFDTIRNGIKEKCVAFSTELPTFHSPLRLNRLQSDMHDWRGHLLHDPHVFGWATQLAVRWAHPANQHVCLCGEGFGVSAAHIIDRPIHFHYHRCFGPKSIYTYLFWERKQLEKMGRAETKIHYGWDDVTGRTEITRQNIYQTETYKRYLPERFDEAGRFRVSALVRSMFRDNEAEIAGVTINDDIMAAWKNFLVYE